MVDETDMEARAWAGMVAGAAGAVAGLIAAFGGQPVAGGVAAAACLGCAAALAAPRPTAAWPLPDRPAVDDAVVAPPPAPTPVPLVDGPADSGTASVIDEDSGLLDHRIFTVTFERKLAAARRHLRPLSLVLIDIGPGLPVGSEARRLALRRWGSMVTSTLRESDVACRVDETTFGVVLEDTPEPGAIWVAERLQIAASCSAGLDPGPVRAAAATYPNHGLHADALLSQAWAAMHRAQQRSAETGPGRLGRVEVPAPEQ